VRAPPLLPPATYAHATHLRPPACLAGTLAWANATSDRSPLSDWTYTDSSAAAGFTARPVYGAWWAPVLVAQGPQLGLGRADDETWARARSVFERVHARQR
jgi:hypothetical protein